MAKRRSDKLYKKKQACKIGNNLITKTCTYIKNNDTKIGKKKSHFYKIVLMIEIGGISSVNGVKL